LVVLKVADDTLSNPAAGDTAPVRLRKPGTKPPMHAD